jgi:hypothetical protein
LRFKASPGKFFARPYLEKTHHKKGLVVAQGEGPEYHKKKKKKVVLFSLVTQSCTQGLTAEVGRRQLLAF